MFARTIRGLSLLLIVSIVTPLWLIHPAAANDLTSRKITLGDPKPSSVTTHTFIFTVPSVSTLGSMKFEYCENTPFVGTPCTAPSGLSLTAATLTGQTGEMGFSKHASSNANNLVLTRTPAAAFGVPVSYTFSNATNPNTDRKTVYVRMSTYASNDASGPITDSGAVVFSTSRGVSVDGFVPPYITLCVGVTVEANCAGLTDHLLDFGDFTTTQTRSLSSQFAVATNDPGGYATFVSGNTMTSGNNTIPALSSPQSSKVGNNQFGINLRANSTPTVGQDVSGTGTGTVAAPYASPNLFAFNNDMIASSPISTEFNRYTVSYVVNISSSQAPGIYSTTLTYIATAAF